MIKISLIAVLIIAAFCRSYPIFKQCDSKWANEQLGTSANTICKAGCAMSSVAMGLAGCGKSFNPSTLNSWLKGHGGYVSGDLIVWSAITPLGLTYRGKVSNGNIKASLDAGHVVVCNVHNGGHWVLATSHNGGNTIYVNDPGYTVTSYELNQIVDGQNVVYGLTGVESVEVSEEYQAPLFNMVILA